MKRDRLNPETKVIGIWTIQWNDTWRAGSYVCYLGTILMMSADTMEEAERLVNDAQDRVEKAEQLEG